MSANCLGGWGFRRFDRQFGHGEHSLPAERGDNEWGDVKIVETRPGIAMIGDTVCVRVVMMRAPQPRRVGTLRGSRCGLPSLVVRLRIVAVDMQMGHAMPVRACNVHRHGNGLRSDEERYRYEHGYPHDLEMIEKPHLGCQWEFTPEAIVQCAGAGSDYRPWRYVCGE